MAAPSDAAALYRLTASEVVNRIKANELSVEQYANALLSQVQERDSLVKAWAFLGPEYVLEQARQLDRVPQADRGPLHGVAVGVKDVIYTKGMSARCPSPDRNIPRSLEG